MGSHLPDSFHIQNYLKQRGVLSPLLSNFTSEYVIKKVHENQMGTEIEWVLQLVAYAGHVNLLGGNIQNIKRSTETLNNASMGVGREVNIEKVSICW
jgi:hypothetical protein